MKSLELKNVNKIYAGNVHAVKDFNIRVEAGEFIVLVGPSGCGKSTVLRMIAGLEEITKGDLFIGEERVNDIAPADRNIAMVFQNYALYGNMTVYENMGISKMIRHESSDAIYDSVTRTAKKVELTQQLNRKPGQLSGGQKQRVALGRSIIKETPLLLMDEPLSNLDAKLRVNTRRELVELHRELKTTIIYVTHDQVEAMTMADRIVIMNNGVIQQIGEPQEVYLYPENAFVASFIGSPPINLLRGRIANGKFIADRFELPLPQERKKLLNDYEGKDVIAGIRPEHFILQNEEASEKHKDLQFASVQPFLTEFLGEETLIHFTINLVDMTARAPSVLVDRKARSFNMAVAADKIHFFDTESLMRIK